MNNYKFGNTPRRKRAYVSLSGTTTLHLRNPYVISCWSAAFPGLGHLLLSKYITGFLLFLWEVFINYQAHVNLAILYSLTGKIEMAKNVIDINWAILYIPTYIFAIYDSYRATVDINNVFILAVKEDIVVEPFKIGALEINFLDKRTPWVAAIWSLLSPGAGQIYIHRTIVAVFLLVSWIVVAYFSHLLPAIQYTLMGKLDMAKSVVNWQWYLNIPSIYVYAMYDAYANCVEENNLYDWEQSKFLKQNYQDKNFKIPYNKREDRGDNMYIISTFDYSINLEIAITSIQMKGVQKENIFAVPVDKANEKFKMLDTIHHSDSVSLIDLASILGAIFMLFGSIYGFVLKWGPVWWGIIGLAFGLASGVVIKYIYLKSYLSMRISIKEPEVVLIVECKETLSEMVVDTLWSNHALGVSKLDHDNNYIS
ncbi:hypothetical protein [Clostridium lacusfryxellense]|uniref:hypothetical protein n=1 Tax=Clostridium lacusfryxellense TaxID=205328 RepID=UPI001C0DEAD0|nr:hypothetical protein [Clostridium lacusfryxellense]MBU3112890.1 hypothetical protein [Clostridium lacusfryxellense]